MAKLITTGILETYTIKPTYLKKDINLHINNENFCLIPEKDITAHELWLVLKWVEEVKINQIGFDALHMFNRAKELGIDRHFKITT